MDALSRLATLTILGIVSACTTTPSSPDRTLPLVSSPGIVIGTLSYQYVDVDAGPAMVVHLERLDAPAVEDYALAVDVDRSSRSGVFTGALPAGIYAFRNAAAADRRYAAGAMAMPFEVRAGAVRDAGHYALDPVFRP